jgi:hypothetical protein
MNSTPLQHFSAPFFKISAIRNNSVICDLVMWEGGDTRPLRNDVWYSTLEKCNILLKHFFCGINITNSRPGKHFFSFRFGSNSE